MYSAYKLNKQGDNRQPWRTPFRIWNQSVVPCPVLTVASWPAHGFLKRQVKWFGMTISFRIFQFIVIHTVKGFGIDNKAEIDVFLELLLFQLLKQEMARVNVDILGISELKWTGMDEFNSDDHYIHYYGQWSLRRNGVAIIVNKRVQNAVLGCILKNDRMISVCFRGKPFSITVIQVYAPTSNAEEAKLISSIKTYKNF